MVIRILLLLLSALFLSQGAEYKIDLDQCGKTTKCFVRESCIEGRDTKTGVLVQRVQETLKNKDCDAIIQMRPFSEIKYHIMMQINIGDSTETIAKTGVSLKQDDVQFECKEEGPTGKAVLFKIVALGNQNYTDKLVFCSFTMESLAGNDLSENFKANLNFPTLEFSLGTPISIVFGFSKANFWRTDNNVPICDPEKIQTLDSFAEPTLKEKIDVYAFPPMKCDQPKSIMTITRQNAQPTALAKEELLICVNTEWTYKDSAGTSKVPENEGFEVTCNAKYCSLCDPLVQHTCVAGCTPFTKKDNSDDCMTATCPGDQWMINKGIVIQGDIECKKEVGVTDSKNSYWYLNNEPEPIKVEKAACFDKTVCNKNAKFENSCPQDVECYPFNTTSDDTEIFCEQEGLKLTWSYQSGIGQPSKLECDFQTGLFTDKESNTAMRHGYKIGCAGKEAEKPVVAAQSNMGAIMGGVGGGLALLAGIGVIGFLLVRRRRNAGAAPKTRNSTEKSGMPTPDEDAANKKIPKRVREPWLTRTRTRPEIESTFRLGTQYNAGDFLGRIIPEFVQFSLENRILAVYQVTAFNAYSDPPADADPNLHKDYGTMNQFWHLFKICEEKNLDCPITWDMIFRFLKIMIGMMQEVQLLNYDLERRIKARLVLFARPIFDELGWKIKEGEEASDTHMRFFVVRVLLWANEKDIREELHRQTIQPLHELESPLRAAVFLYACRFTPHGAAEMRTKYWKSVVIEDPKDEKKDKFGTMRQHLLYGLCNTYNVSSKHKKFMTMNDVLDRMVDFNFVPVDQTFSPVDMYWAYRGATEYYTNCVEAVWAFAAKQNFAPRISAHRQLQMEAKLPADAGEKEVEPLRTAWMKATVDTCYLVAECCTYRSMHKAFAENAVPHLKYAEQNNDELPHNKLLSERAENINWRLSSDATKTKTEGREKKTLQVKVVQEFEASFVTFENITPGVPREME